MCARSGAKELSLPFPRLYFASPPDLSSIVDMLADLWSGLSPVRCAVRRWTDSGVVSVLWLRGEALAGVLQWFGRLLGHWSRSFFLSRSVSGSLPWLWISGWLLSRLWWFSLG